MNKRIRQYIGLIVAIILYYVVHEGTHLLFALSIGAFKNVNIMGLGVQIDIYVDKMTQTQLGVFCLLGSVATIILAYILVALIDKIGKLSSHVLKTCAYIHYTLVCFVDFLVVET